MKLPFGRKSKAVEADMAEATDPVDQPSTETGPPKTEKPVKPVKVVKPKVQKKASGLFGRSRAGFTGSAQLGIELENGRFLYFNAMEDGTFERLEDKLPVGTPMLTAYRNDWRVFSPKALPDSKAKGFSARETDALERMAVINESKLGRIYSTPLNGLAPGEKRIPILEVLDDLLGGKHGSVVSGVLFGNNDLAILYAFNDATMGAQQMQVSVNPENLQAVASSFVSVAGLPDDTEVILFEQGEFLRRLAEKAWTPYPVAGGVYGLSKGVLPLAIMGVGGVAALATCAYAGYWYMQDQDLKKMTAAHEQKLGGILAMVGQAVIEKYPAYIEATSIDVLEAVDIAAALRNEGGTVEAKLTRATFDYVVLTDLFSPGKTHSEIALRSAIQHEPVTGCTKSAIETTGGMREIKSQYSCPFSGNSLARFGW